MMKLKQIVVFQLIILVTFIFNIESYAEIFHVTTPDEFQAAIASASRNRQDDFILVAPGEFVLDSSLVYDPDDDEEYGIFIGGYTLNKPVIKGSENMRSILMHIQYAPCLSCWEDKKAQVLIADLVFTDSFNPEGTAGLFIFRRNETVTVANCKFSDLIAYGDGALGGLGILISNGTVVMSNNIFVDNVAHEVGGAAISSSGSELIVHNNTFYSNTSPGVGGLAINWDTRNWDNEVNSYIFNNIIFGNDGLAIKDFYFDIYVSSGLDWPYILVDSNVIGEGSRHIEFERIFHPDDYDPVDAINTIHLDPLLDLNFVPLSGSPCIDAGVNPLPGSYPFPPYDIGWTWRLIDGNLDGDARYDIGAREFTPVLEERKCNFKFSIYSASK